MCFFGVKLVERGIRTVQLVDRQADTERRGARVVDFSVGHLLNGHSWRNVRNKIGGDTPPPFLVKRPQIVGKV